MYMRYLATLSLVIALAACASPQPISSEHATTAVSRVVQWQSEYLALATQGRVYGLDAARSAVKIYVFRAGTAAALGHNHVLSVPHVAGYVFVPDEDLRHARFDAEFRLDEMTMDDSAERAALGSAYATELTSHAIQRTREHMLGADNLQADRFPYVRIHALQISGELPKLASQVEIELHGQRRTLWLPLNVTQGMQGVEITGALVVRQSEFGVRPYAVLGGFLAVQDELVVEFFLAAH